ncbi:PREDICTED: elongation of very long chain fatty acids protein AAEL008004-like, partial [Papilio polytes]|uniref:elongation of very long chain fatty acids protein AAEL008004-like n=1 Tax=Papilio polytes TaxID=76194 RepID=UPI0006764DAB
MDTAVENMRQKYNFLINEAVHKKTNSWLLVSDPVSLFVILASYYYFCTWLGPLWMRDRKPFQLKKTLIVYNACQVLMSLYLVYCGLVFVFSGDYNLLCAPVDYSDRPSADWIAGATWWFFIAKLTELLDTVFFVLRKKDKQISTLHIYHHTVMPIITWIGVKYLPGGHSTLTALLNSFVHVVMYGYYLVSGLGPQYQKYLWWKKHVTSLQLIQFVIIALHNAYPLVTNCNFPKWFNIMAIINAVAFVYMFGNFYYHSYIKNNKSR